MASGSIRRANGRSRWEVRVDAGIDPKTGKRRQISRSFATKREAQEALPRLLVEVGDGQHLGTRSTFGDLLERWYDQRSPDWSPKTVAEHRRFIDGVLKPALGDIPLYRLRTEDLDHLYARLRKRGQTGRPLSPASVRRYHAAIHSALRQAVKWRWIAVNPADTASPPRVYAPEIQPPEPATVVRLIGEAERLGPEFALFLRLSVVTGARRSEICGLQHRDFDHERRRVTISRGVVDGPDGPIVKDTKTHLVHGIAVDEQTLAEVRQQHQRMTDRAALGEVELDADPFVFSNDPTCSRPWRPDFVTTWFARARLAAGAQGTRLHDLRHFVGTQLGDAGFPVASVARRLGHSRSSTTLDMYTKAVDATDVRAAEALASLIDGPAPRKRRTSRAR